MKPNDAVEIQVVLKDGTVMRWTGKIAARVWAALDWSWLDEVEKPTVSNPLRKVTEIVGDYDLGCRDDGSEDGLVSQSADYFVLDRVFVPDKVANVPGVTRRYRITVESMEDRDA